MHMLPATKAIPKEMLPIVDKPMIQYIVDEIVAAGIKEIVPLPIRPRMRLRTTSTPLTNSKRCLSSASNASCWQKCSLSVRRVTIMNVRQAQPLGLGHSILCARPVVGDNPFIVVLPDIIIDTASADPLRYNRRQWWRVSMKPAVAVLAKRMKGDLSEYSVIQTKEALETEGQVSRIVEFIENPISRRRWIRI